MDITHLDHLVLTVTSIEVTIAFYKEALGIDVQEFSEGRYALYFGHQKINLQQAGNEFEPKAHYPSPGSADLCFVTKTPLHRVIQELQDSNVEVFLGPVERTGATGRILSVYIRDPDLNLIEICNYV